MADQAVTLATATSASNGTKVEVLPNEVRIATGFTHRFRIPYDIINTSTWTTQGDTVTVTLGTTPAKFLVNKAAVEITTAFATTGTLTIQVGTDGDPDNFIDAQSAKTAAVLIGDSGAAPVTEAGTVGVAADVLVARFTTQASTGAPADITAGVADIYLGIVDMADLN